jgi:hypothetical protein
MPGYEGFWIHGDTGRGHRITDHALEVIADPGRYGLAPAAIHAITGGHPINQFEESADSPRGRIILAAARIGWVRVRGHRGDYTVQLHGRAATRLPRVMRFLRRAGLGRYITLRVHDFATGWQRTFLEGEPDVARALAAGEIPDAVEPAPAAGAAERPPLV